VGSLRKTEFTGHLAGKNASSAVATKLVFKTRLLFVIHCPALLLMRRLQFLEDVFWNNVAFSLIVANEDQPDRAFLTET
jgi:hypothetical protein